MASHILAIYDDQIGYAEALIRQWKRTDSLYRIHQFTEEKALKTFIEKQEITCLLLSEAYEHMIDEIQADYYFCLTQVREKVDADEKNYIYRYQSVDQIYEEIIRICKEKPVEKPTLASTWEEPKIIGIYNPVHRNGQTTYAKALAKAWAKQGLSVLYLNMEEYAGVVLEEKEFADLGEVIYYLKQDRKSVNYRLASFVKKEEGYAFLNPIGMSQDLRSITKAEWLDFFEVIKEGSGYQIFILDLDSCVQGLLEILETCDQIHMPMLEGRDDRGKREQFLWNARRLQGEKLVAKIDYKYLANSSLAEEQKMVEESIV